MRFEHVALDVPGSIQMAEFKKCLWAGGSRSHRGACVPESARQRPESAKCPHSCISNWFLPPLRVNYFD
jgi:hypothetical protein